MMPAAPPFSGARIDLSSGFKEVDIEELEDVAVEVVEDENGERGIRVSSGDRILLKIKKITGELDIKLGNQESE